jgi:hypothetical protein
MVSLAAINSLPVPYIKNLTQLFQHVNTEASKFFQNAGNLYCFNTVWYPEDFTTFIGSSVPTSKIDNGTFKCKFYMLHMIWGIHGGENYMVQ